MPLRRHSVLIVESGIAHGAKLQSAIEMAGADSHVLSDPGTAAGRERSKRFKSTAAVVNVAHRAFGESLAVPVVFYQDARPARQVVLKLLKALL